MAENETVETGASVGEFLASIEAQEQQNGWGLLEASTRAGLPSRVQGKVNVRAAVCLGLGILWAASPLCAQRRPTSGPITRVDHFYAESGAMEALLGFLKSDLGVQGR